MTSMTLEQRNAQKLNNLLNMANLNLKNKDIYFFLKCNVKVLFTKLALSQQDSEILAGHVTAISAELSTSKWDLRQFDPKKYQKFLNDLFNKIDFRKVDTNFMFKCRDLLEISPIKDDLYKRRMEFFDKKLPKIGSNIVAQNINNNNNNNKAFNNLKNTVNMVNLMMNKTNNLQNQPNNNTNIQNKPVNPFANMNQTININNTNNFQLNKNNDLPVNPFADMSPDSNPYMQNAQNFEPSPYNQNVININNTNDININNNKKELLRSIAPIGLNKTNTINKGNIFVDPYKPKKIPENIKENIIKELKIISNDIYNGKIESCRQHSIEALLCFKQIFPDN